MCRQYGHHGALMTKVGTSYFKTRSITRRNPGNWQSLAYLKCPKLASGLDSCELEFLPEHATKCHQMVARCSTTKSLSPTTEMMSTTREELLTTTIE